MGRIQFVNTKFTRLITEIAHPTHERLLARSELCPPLLSSPEAAVAEDGGENHLSRARRKRQKMSTDSGTGQDSLKVRSQVRPRQPRHRLFAKATLKRRIHARMCSATNASSSIGANASTNVLERFCGVNINLCQWENLSCSHSPFARVRNA